ALPVDKVFPDFRSLSSGRPEAGPGGSIRATDPDRSPARTQTLGTASKAPLPAPPNTPIGAPLMNIAPKTTFVLHQRHLLGMEGLSPDEIVGLLDLAEEFVDLNRQIEKKGTSLRGRTQINLFFEASTRTQSSFELAGKRLGADVMNMS